MSTTASIGNFYVDFEGVERPIRYKATDLVNRPAPQGYHWEKAHPNAPHPTEQPLPCVPKMVRDAVTGDVQQWGWRTLSVTLNSDKNAAGFYDYYVCVKDATERAA